MLVSITNDISVRIVVPLFGAASAAPNKGITILYRFRFPKTLLNPPVNGKIQGLFKALECFSSTFQDNLVYSSTFQASANPDKTLPGIQS